MGPVFVWFDLGRVTEDHSVVRLNQELYPKFRSHPAGRFANSLEGDTPIRALALLTNATRISNCGVIAAEGDRR